MRRKRLRLVACVSLVAFLVANTHAGTALAAHLLAAHSELGHARDAAAAKHPASAQQEVKPERPGCCHGQKHTNRAGDGSEGVGDQDDCPCAPSCPDCPKGPCGPKCPCPGGCALCNVAKIPHVAPVASLPASAPCLGASLPEPHVFYTPPPAGRLIRPPRS